MWQGRGGEKCVKTVWHNLWQTPNHRNLLLQTWWLNSSHHLEMLSIYRIRKIIKKWRLKCKLMLPLRVRFSHSKPNINRTINSNYQWFFWFFFFFYLLIRPYSAWLFTLESTYFEEFFVHIDVRIIERKGKSWKLFKKLVILILINFNSEYCQKP